MSEPRPHAWTLFTGYHLTSEQAHTIGESTPKTFAGIVAEMEPCFGHASMRCDDCGKAFTPDVAGAECVPNDKSPQENLADSAKEAVDPFGGTLRPEEIARQLGEAIGIPVEVVEVSLDDLQAPLTGPIVAQPGSDNLL